MPTENQTAAGSHAPITTLEELDALDEAEMVEGHRSAEMGDPEPGANHSRAYHHGWRTRMMDLEQVPVPPVHRELTRQLLARGRKGRAK